MPPGLGATGVQPLIGLPTTSGPVSVVVTSLSSGPKLVSPRLPTKVETAGCTASVGDPLLSTLRGRADRVGAGPDQVPHVAHRGQPLRRGHVEPRHAHRIVVDVRREGVGHADVELAGAEIDAAREAQAVSQLVHDDLDEIAERPGLGVQAVVPVDVGIAVVEAAVERRLDVGDARIQIVAGQLIRERLRVEDVGRQSRDDVAGDAGDQGLRARVAERDQAAAAIERREHRIDDDRDRAVERLAPDVGGVLERDLALLAQRGAGVAAHRARRRRVVEADARRIEVVDHEGRLGDAARGAATTSAPSASRPAARVERARRDRASSPPARSGWPDAALPGCRCRRSCRSRPVAARARARDGRSPPGRRAGPGVHRHR